MGVGHCREEIKAQGKTKHHNSRGMFCCPVNSGNARIIFRFVLRRKARKGVNPPKTQTVTTEELEPSQD